MTEENQHVHPQKFKFFRVLLSDFSKKLAIPKRLTKYFIQEKLTRVTLLSPLCETWDVKINGDNEGLHFAEGWERFAVTHRLSFGDLLVFESVGAGLTFHVTIFDKTTCEREYNVRNIRVFGDDHLPGHGENSEKEYSGCFEKQTTPSSGERTLPMMGQESNKNREKRSTSKRKGIQKPVHQKAKEATKQGYKSCSHFEITISPKCKYAVNIPAKFAKSNDILSLHKMLLISDPSGGRSWPVKLSHYKRSDGHDNYLQLSTGWRVFHVDNDLKDGDACVFEIKSKNEMLVRIYRSCEGEEGANTNQDEYGSRRSKSTLQHVLKSKRAAPVQWKQSPSKVTCTSKAVEPVQFGITIVPSNICKVGRPGGYMTIPSAFVSSVGLSTEKEVVFVDSKSREWPVKILYHEERRWCRTGHGWVTFCRENDVEVGDVCVFNFKYKEKKATFQVKVIKSVKNLPTKSEAAGGKLY